MESKIGFESIIWGGVYKDPCSTFQKLLGMDDEDPQSLTTFVTQIAQSQYVEYYPTQVKSI